MSSNSVVELLLDPVRLMVAGSMAGKVRSIVGIAARTGLDEHEILAAIEALIDVGLIDQVDDGYTLPRAGLRRLTAEMTETDNRQPHR